MTKLINIVRLLGCQKGPHSNVKPEEPESITGKKDGRELNEQLKDFGQSEAKPIAAKLQRPCFDQTPLVRLNPTKATTLKVPNPIAEQNGNSSDGKPGEIPVGESCKNGGCKAVSELLMNSSASRKFVHPCFKKEIVFFKTH